MLLAASYICMMLSSNVNKCVIYLYDAITLCYQMRYIFVWCYQAMLLNASYICMMLSSNVNIFVWCYQAMSINASYICMMLSSKVIKCVINLYFLTNTHRWSTRPSFIMLTGWNQISSTVVISYVTTVCHRVIPHIVQ